MRALSILLVVIAHVLVETTNYRLYAIFGHLGNYGVRIFFLISGFLITELLLKEYDRSGAISLKNFYMRRLLRIFPAFYLFLIVAYAMSAAGIIDLAAGDVFHAATYTMNYHDSRSWYLNHTWSLSVEEQFYLLWPALLLWLKPRRALRGTILVILVVPAIRAVMIFGFDAGPAALGRNFQAVCDALATGCLLSGVYNQLGESEIYRKLQAAHGYILLPLGLLVVSGVTFRIDARLYYIAGQSIANVGGALLLDYVVRRPASYTGRVLNVLPLRLIGQWSYSIYLWQEVFLDGGESRLHLHWPVNILWVTGASLVSYYAVERQFLKLKKRFNTDRPRPMTLHAS